MIEMYKRRKVILDLNFEPLDVCEAWKTYTSKIIQCVLSAKQHGDLNNDEAERCLLQLKFAEESRDLTKDSKMYRSIKPTDFKEET